MFLFLFQESLQTQQNGVEWTILSQGSRELEGLLKLVSKERLQLERNFVLATQVRDSFVIFVSSSSAPFDRYSQRHFFDWCRYHLDTKK